LVKNQNAHKKKEDSQGSQSEDYKMAAKQGAKLRQGWRKPLEGYLMLNIDASYDDDRRCASAGAIIRDGSGGMVAATSTFIPHLVDAPMAEACALKEGLMLAQCIGGNRLVRLYGGQLKLWGMEVLLRTRLLQYMMNVTLFEVVSRTSLLST
jgi:hypothetical protein